MPFNRKYEISNRLRKVSKYYLRGCTQLEIVDELKKDGIQISQSQVSRDLKKIHQQWMRCALKDFKRVMLRELAKLDRLEQTYWDAWEKSIEDYQQKTIKQKGRIINENENSKIKTKDIEETRRNIVSFGNPALLAGIERCIEMRCKILGINASIKTELKGREDRALTNLSNKEIDNKMDMMFKIIIESRDDKKFNESQFFC